MFTDKLPEQARALSEHAGQSAQVAIKSTQRLTHAAVDGISESSRQLRTSAKHVSDSTAQYIRDDPIKAVLIAAATGAAFAALVGFITRSRGRT